MHPDRYTYTHFLQRNGRREAMRSYRIIGITVYYTSVLNVDTLILLLLLDLNPIGIHSHKFTALL